MTIIIIVDTNENTPRELHVVQVIVISHLAGNKCFNVCTRMMQ